MKPLATFLMVTGVVFLLSLPTSTPCSSFRLDTDGMPIVGANFDNCEHQEGLVIVNKRGVQKRGLSQGSTGEYVSWTSRFGSVTFAVACRELPRYGMNEAGLVVTSVSFPESKCPAPDERPQLDGNIWVQYVLDNFSTVQEVAARDSTIIIVNARDHYLISDKDDGCLIVECRDGVTHYYVDESAPVAAVTKAPYADCLNHWKRGVIPDPDPDGSVEQFLNASQWMDDYQVGPTSDLDYAFDILDHTSQRGCTQWKIVFDQQNLRFYFRTKKVKAIRQCDLQELDFDCSTPMQMLDVNEKLRGDISLEFRAYSKEAVLGFVEKACQTSGIDKTAEEMGDLLKFFESFECVEAGQ